MTRFPPALAALVVTAVLAAAAGSVLAVGAVLALAFNGLTAAFGVLFLVAVVGAAAYMFVRYRQGRQDELLELLTAAVAAGVPLAPALRVYVRERPRDRFLRMWAVLAAVGWVPAAYVLVSYVLSDRAFDLDDDLDRFLGAAGFVTLTALFVFALPLVYHRFWHRERRFDGQVERLADLLDDGLPVAEALREVPAVAPREARLAAAVGEPTGRLALCLRRADKERMTAAWLELVPRMLYPLVILFVVFNVASFHAVFIIPKMKRIFDEFEDATGGKAELPWATRWLIAASEFLSDFGFLVVPLVLVGGPLAVAALVSPAVRWHLPGLRWVYRSQIRAQVLRLLGAQVEAGRPAPAALRLLAEADEFPPVVRRALGRAADAVGRGEPLDPALHAAGLLPAGLLPLVRSAEATGTLPWALAELGDHVGGRAVRVVRRLSVVVAPLCVIAVGGVVALVALGMFLPLVVLLRGLSQ